MRVSSGRKRCALLICLTGQGPHRSNLYNRVSHAENVAFATVLHRRSPSYFGMLDYVLI